MKKILVVFGTRPEAIKLYPLIKELRARAGIECTVCITGQHREMLDSVLADLGLVADIDLGIMKDSQSLFDITIDVLEKMSELLSRLSPSIVLVHGDTASAFVSALACFYMRIPIAHIEAGLRSDDIFDPYPEEFNRRAISLVSSIDFAPTSDAAERLLREGKRAERIFVTGNTVIDTLRYTVRRDYSHPITEWARGKRLILFTAHRRESIGEPMRRIFRALRRIAKEYEDVRIVYPIHMNPSVREIAKEVLFGCEGIRITDPLDVTDLHNVMSRSYIVVTDSGGLQEEAAFLNLPVLVVRERTERGEGVQTGAIKVIGTQEEGVYKNIKLLLEDKEIYERMSKAKNPFGNGHASKRIADILCGLKSELI